MSKKIIKTSDGPKLQDTHTGRLAGSVPTKPLIAGAAPAAESHGSTTVQTAPVQSAVELAGEVFNGLKNREDAISKDFSASQVSRWFGEDDAKITDARDDLKYRLSVASIIGMGMGEPHTSSLSFLGDYLGLPSADAKSENIYREVRAEFGPTAVGHGLKPKLIPISIAQRINYKYPTIAPDGELTRKINPKALKIARRYMTLFGNPIK